MATDLIAIEVALAFPKEQHLIKVMVPRGTSMQRAVKLSGIFDKFSVMPDDVRQMEHGMGIFGKEVKDTEDYELKAGDRIEIYRPLLIDPKEARISRAKDEGKGQDKGKDDKVKD